jgi:hypothetical protein
MIIGLSQAGKDDHGTISQRQREKLVLSQGKRKMLIALPHAE